MSSKGTLTISSSCQPSAVRLLYLGKNERKKRKEKVKRERRKRGRKGEGRKKKNKKE